MLSTLPAQLAAPAAAGGAPCRARARTAPRARRSAAPDLARPPLAGAAVGEGRAGGLAGCGTCSARSAGGGAMLVRRAARTGIHTPCPLRARPSTPASGKPSGASSCPTSMHPVPSSIMTWQAAGQAGRQRVSSAAGDELPSAWLRAARGRAAAAAKRTARACLPASRCSSPHLPLRLAHRLLLQLAHQHKLCGPRGEGRACAVQPGSTARSGSPEHVLQRPGMAAPGSPAKPCPMHHTAGSPLRAPQTSCSPPNWAGTLDRGAPSRQGWFWSAPGSSAATASLSCLTVTLRWGGRGSRAFCGPLVNRAAAAPLAPRSPTGCRPVPARAPLVQPGLQPVTSAWSGRSLAALLQTPPTCAARLDPRTGSG